MVRISMKRTEHGKEDEMRNGKLKESKTHHFALKKIVNELIIYVFVCLVLESKLREKLTQTK